MKRNVFRDQRGTVIAFTLVMLLSLLAFGGLASDVAYYVTVRTELQRSMDAAALAGAGNLGFSDVVFPAARDAARQLAALNPHSRLGGVGTITLELNAGNNPNGNIVLGVWDGAAQVFAPSLDGAQVNAVRCQYATTIPTSFLSIVGITTLGISASAIAVAAPPATLPINACPFPLGVTACSSPGGTVCGSSAVIAFTTAGGGGSPSGGTNRGGWVDVVTPLQQADLANLLPALDAVADGRCAGPPLPINTLVPASTSDDSVVLRRLARDFTDQFSRSPVYTVTNAAGQPVYEGKGWEIFMPLLESVPCPLTTLNAGPRLVGWSRFVITQVIFNPEGSPGTACAVSNPGDPLSFPNCASPDPAWRAIFGYVRCTVFNGVIPIIPPAPTAALASQIRLVR